MRIAKLPAGVLFLVLAVCAGSLNFFQRTTVLGAPPIPLTSVAHDATLAGSGKTSSPLGVAAGGIGTGQLANGAVTLPKLSIAGSPATGSTVGYNGSGLAWQAASSASGGVNVVDSAGHSYPMQSMLGLSIAGALFQTATETFVIPISVGSIPDARGQLDYASSDCSGTPYFLDYGPSSGSAYEPANLLIQTFPYSYFISNSTLYYATGAAQQVNINSQGTNGQCTNNPQGVISVFSVGTLNLASAFVPPFHLQVN